MDRNALENFLTNPYNIISVIQYINNEFPKIYYDLNVANVKKYCPAISDTKLNSYNLSNDAYSYYLNGHCFSYTTILMSIFDNIPIRYNNNEHAMVKINDWLFDVRGLIFDDTAHESLDSDLYMMSVSFEINDDFEKKIEQNLIAIGKNYLNNLVNKSVKKKTLNKNL